MRRELVVGNENPLFKPKLQKLAIAAERAHLRAHKHAAQSVANMARAGRSLRKFRDLADDKEWEDLIVHHFEGSERTVQRYMYLAKHWSLLEANAPPEGLTSQRKAIQLLRTLLYGERATGQVVGTRRKPCAAAIDVTPAAIGDASAPPPFEVTSATSSAAEDERRTVLTRMYDQVLHALAELTKELSQLAPPHSAVQYALGSIARAQRQVEESGQTLFRAEAEAHDDGNRKTRDSAGEAASFSQNDDLADLDDDL
ncbi:MAG: hypothetical protein ACREHD_12815 [Pirellulales bacterium]